MEQTSTAVMEDIQQRASLTNRYFRTNIDQNSQWKPVASSLTYKLAYASVDPVSNISLAAEILETTKLTDEQKALISIVLRNAGRLTDLVATIKRSTSRF